MYKKEDIKVTIAIATLIIIQIFIYFIIWEEKNKKHIICLGKCENCEYCDSIEYNKNSDS